MHDIFVLKVLFRPVPVVRSEFSSWYPSTCPWVRKSKRARFAGLEVLFPVISLDMDRTLQSVESGPGAPAPPESLRTTCYFSHHDWAPPAQGGIQILGTISQDLMAAVAMRSQCRTSQAGATECRRCFRDFRKEDRQWDVVSTSDSNSTASQKGEI